MVTNIINGRIIAGDRVLEGVLVLKDGVIQGVNKRKSPGAEVITPGVLPKISHISERRYRHSRQFFYFFYHSFFFSIVIAHVNEINGL